MKKHLFGSYLFRVTFWGINKTRETRTVKVIIDTPDKDSAGAEAERLSQKWLKTYIYRKVELLPSYTDPWNYR